MDGLTISYAILAHNEVLELTELLNLLVAHKRPQDEIVVMFDGKCSHEMNSVVSVFGYNVRTVERALNGDFASQKNALTDECSGRWVFNLDADELPSATFVEALPSILESVGDSVEAFFVPRMNIVTGTTQNDIAIMRDVWRWQINERGWINYPDWQLRLYRRLPTIRWKNAVHERLEGFTTHSELPTEEEYSLTHVKTFSRQFEQNCRYNRLEHIARLKEHNAHFGTEQVVRNIGSFGNIMYAKWLHPYQGTWDEQFFTEKSIGQLAKYIQYGDVVVDIGAQAGVLTVAFSKLVGDGGKVIAYEPNPSAFEVVNQNTMHVPFSNNTRAFNYGIASERCTEVFHYSDIGGCNGGFATHTDTGIGVTGHTHPVRVYCVNLVDHLTEIGVDPLTVSFIKIDTEGYDMYILDSIRESGILNKMTRKPYILTEIYSGLTEREAEKLIQTIYSIGYTPYDYEGDVDCVRPITNASQIDIRSGHNLMCIPS